MDSRDPDGLLVRLISDGLDALGLSAQQLAPLIDAEVITPSALADAAARMTGNPELGLELAYATTIRALSPVVYLMMSAPTLGQALDDMTRYAAVAVHRPTTATLIIDRSSTAFVFGPEDGGRTYSEYLAALLVRLFRYLVDDPQLRPMAARFTHAPPQDVRPRHLIFGIDLSYDQPRNALVFSPEQTQRPCAHASTALHALHERALREALQSELDDSLLVRVRQALGERLANESPSMSGVARAVRLSERTLQRRLRERGTSFERLLKEVRRQRTLQLLGQHSLSIEAVALEAGYHDVSSFHRAFRGWTGVTPAVYRQRLRAAAAGDGASQEPAPPRKKSR